MKNKASFVELAKASISEKRNVVVSSCSEGGFTVAQQLETDEGQHTTSVFLKGAFHVGSIDGLYNMRDALNVAIEAAEAAAESADDWDGEEAYASYNDAEW